MATDERKLKANGSNVEAPGKKVARGEEYAVDESAPGWAQQMQRMMMSVMVKVDGTAAEVKEAKSLAQEAKNEAKEAKEVAVAMGGEVNIMKKEIAQMKGTGAKAAVTLGGGVREEEKLRTITFGNFPEDTRSEYIIEEINKKVEAVKADLDANGVFAYGKKYAIRGGARFKTEESMMAFLRRDDTEAQFEVDGHRIYMNRDIRKSAEDEARDKAVRKLVRAIIEEEGGDGSATKKNIDADYRRGIVRYKDVRVGEYTNGKMELKGDANKLEGRYSRLME
jgi:hypothetical protein